MILFCHSFFLAQDQKQQGRMKPYPPLSTLLAAALVRRDGHEVALFDATFADGPEAFGRALAEARPSAVVLMEDNFNFLTKMCTAVRRETALSMVRAARAQGATVAVNGPDSADNPELYLRAGADAVVLGEGETAVAQAVGCWARGEALEAVGGLMLPDGEGGSCVTAPPLAIKALETLPLPAWDLVDIEAYRRAWTGAHGEFSWNIAASRGCPYACNWCAKPTFGRRYTVRPPQDVVREMVRLKVEVAPDHLWFTDDILGLDLRWIGEFSAGVVAAGARIPFSMQTRVNLMTDAAVAALAAAGAREVWLGVETGSQKVLDAMNKAATVEAARTATRTLKRHGVKACWFIQLGYPGETWDDLMATRDLIRQEAPHEIGVSVAYPLPGTEFHDRVSAQLGRQRNWKDTGELAMLFQGAYDTAFYREIRDLLHREVDEGRRDDAAWAALEAQAGRRRSPQPSVLSVEA